MNIDKFRVPDEGIYENAPSYLRPFKSFDGEVTDNNEKSFIQFEILKFCGCGDWEKSFEYIHNILAFIHTRKDYQGEGWFDKWQQESRKYFLSEGQEQFIYYLLDKEELIEHGYTLPGCLSQKGLELLEDLTELKARNWNVTCGELEFYDPKYKS